MLISWFTEIVKSHAALLRRRGAKFLKAPPRLD
jgi:hypothetical protein